MPIRRKLFIAAVLLVAVVAPPATSAAGASSERAPESYIVVLREGTNAAEVAEEHRRAHRAEIRHVYRVALSGYAATIPAARLSGLRADPRVSYIEADGVVRTTAQTLPWGINRIDADVSSTLAGNSSGAVGTVNAYVIDSGVSAHADLNLVAHGNWTGDGKNYD